MEEKRIEVIGIIRSPYKTTEKAPHQGKDEVFEIEVKEEYGKGLSNIEEYSHLHIFYYLHESHGFSLLTVTPWSSEERGIFSTRSPNRPTPIGYSVVELIERKGNTLTVKGLDAIDGTPVIDIKPYSSKLDARPNAKKREVGKEKRGITPRVYEWGTETEWKTGKEGILSDVKKEDIRVGCPPDFGGKPEYWSPEHLFISSVEVCVLTTFLNYLAREKIELLGYRSSAVGRAQLVEGIFKFTEVVIQPVVETRGGDRDTVEKILLKSKQRCLVSSSLNIPVTMIHEIKNR
jgi:tRNA-Thr(GGU) m(6)t(6)A37 methyltransferase TsaA